MNIQIIFILIGLVGVLCIYPLAFKFFPNKRKEYLLAGALCIGSAVILGVSHKVSFPLWLWLFPIGLYFAATYVIPNRRYRVYTLICAAVLTVGFLLFMGKKTSDLYNKNSPKEIPVVQESMPPVTDTLSTVTSTPPVTRSIQELDQYIYTLEAEKKRLEDELTSQKQEIEKLKQEIESKNEKLEDFKDLSKKI